jgi:opacity protein-like surface antigen
MGCRVLLAVLAAGMGVFAAEAQAAGPWYVAGSVGGYFREESTAPTTFSSGSATAPGEVTRTFDPGVVLNLAVGYRLPAHLRAEVELGYAHYNIDTVTPTVAALPALNGVQFGHSTGSDLQRTMATANLFYDLPVAGCFVPYVGGGLGAIHIQSGTTTSISATGAQLVGHRPSGDDGVALIEAGVTIAVTDAIAIVPAYRYVREFGDVANNGTEIAHIVKLGMRYSF